MNVKTSSLEFHGSFKTCIWFVIVSRLYVEKLEEKVHTHLDLQNKRHKEEMGSGRYNCVDVSTDRGIIYFRTRVMYGHV